MKTTNFTDKYSFIFWQTMMSPHMTPIAGALADRGHTVKFVVTDGFSRDRIEIGWKRGDSSNFELLNATSKTEIQKIIQGVDSSAVHLTQGIRGNGGVRVAQDILHSQNLPFWPMIETIDERTRLKHIKRAIYRHILRDKNQNIEGILSIGGTTRQWLQKRGVDQDKIFPFTYFLPDDYFSAPPRIVPSKAFRVLFVGRLLKLKRIDLLIHAISQLDEEGIHLNIIGDGPELNHLRELSDQLLPGRVSMYGPLDRGAVLDEMNASDCLVLPSEHDGWGVVISEALSAGLPVICSDRCGASEIVSGCETGYVFGSGNLPDLIAALGSALRSGAHDLERRFKLAQWASCLSASAGAEYLEKLVFSSRMRLPPPKTPWDNVSA